MEMLRYSVLMSVYHKEKPEYLIEAIESMLKQTIPPEQFVIVEDGPLTDELNDVIDKYKNEEKELFTIIKLKENRGLGVALDEGINACRNELIARMDSDDISIPERCEKQLELFRNYEELDILSGTIAEFKYSIENVISLRKVPDNMELIKKQMRRRSAFNHPAVMYKKSSVLKYGGYGSSARKEDHDLFSRMIFGGCKAHNLSEVILYYRLNIDNIRRRKSWKNVKSYIEIMWINLKRGYCDWKDFFWVVTAQFLYLILPIKLLEKIIFKYCRE